MRTVIWTDKGGYKHRSLVRDTDPDSAAHMGVPLDPPDLSQLDWDGVQRDIHNRLVDMGLHDYQDVLVAQTGITSAINSALKRRILELYKQQREANND